MTTKPCSHCSKGKSYVPGELLPYDCTRCNGTGVAADLGWVILAIIFAMAVFFWVAFRVAEGLMR